VKSVSQVANILVCPLVIGWCNALTPPVCLSMRCLVPTLKTSVEAQCMSLIVVALVTKFTNCHVLTSHHIISIAVLACTVLRAVPVIKNMLWVITVLGPSRKWLGTACADGELPIEKTVVLVHLSVPRFPVTHQVLS
tara:strand:+ start:509 stop:919 length:411 start_codon:yes stop_codon:yes gene_type:complete